MAGERQLGEVEPRIVIRAATEPRPDGRGENNYAYQSLVVLITPQRSPGLMAGERHEVCRTTSPHVSRNGAPA